ncbi:hypothetical protein PAXRUDRAFT_28375 [Paxillus rubicundulus Ve08.2h10]|uniref:Uncharacterized protein n=1 Tax=Paxillus rubicundulus Ve08.2h10 TaxID=930991 RepID=A0A0D0C9M9_9AGAM|nr:hypothetical protein PAXRUDRAFT_28375 [Paxillus rubicundulus Ve08.2h10]
MENSSLILISPSSEKRAKEHREKVAKHEKKVRKMISKPKGHPGRHDGYSIIEALGLIAKKAQYNVICMTKDIICNLVVKYLDTSCSLRQQQDKLLVKKVIKQAQSELKKLRRSKKCQMKAEMKKKKQKNKRKLNDSDADEATSSKGAAKKRKLEAQTTNPSNPKSNIHSDHHGKEKQPKAQQKAGCSNTVISDDEDDTGGSGEMEVWTCTSI